MVQVCARIACWRLAPVLLYLTYCTQRDKKVNHQSRKPSIQKPNAVVAPCVRERGETATRED